MHSIYVSSYLRIINALHCICICIIINYTYIHILLVIHPYYIAIKLIIKGLSSLIADFIDRKSNLILPKLMLIQFTAAIHDALL